MSVVENIKYKYDDFTLSVDRMEIPENGITALMGASGSGKTTLARILLGLEECSEWSWKFGSEDLAKLAPPDRKIGVVFQDFALFPHMTAKENIFFAAEARGVENANELYAELSKNLELSQFENRKASVFSGGEKQRTAMARAIIGRPRFLILDEPFSALDTELKESARHLVKSVVLQAGIPALLITHDKEDVNVLAQRTYKIERGQILDFLS